MCRMRVRRRCFSGPETPESKMKKDSGTLIQSLILSLLVGVLLLLIGWVKSDISKLNDKVDQLTTSYVEMVGELRK